MRFVAKAEADKGWRIGDNQQKKWWGQAYQWRYLKRVELRNLCCSSLEHLRSELRKAIARLRYKRRILNACLRQPGYL